MKLSTFPILFLFAASIGAFLGYDKLWEALALAAICAALVTIINLLDKNEL